MKGESIDAIIDKHDAVETPLLDKSQLPEEIKQTLALPDYAQSKEALAINYTDLRERITHYRSMIVTEDLKPEPLTPSTVKLALYRAADALTDGNRVEQYRKSLQQETTHEHDQALARVAQKNYELLKEFQQEAREYTHAYREAMTHVAGAIRFGKRLEDAVDEHLEQNTQRIEHLDEELTLYEKLEQEGALAQDAHFAGKGLAQKHEDYEQRLAEQLTAAIEQREFLEYFKQEELPGYLDNAQAVYENARANVPTIRKIVSRINLGIAEYEGVTRPALQLAALNDVFNEMNLIAGDEQTISEEAVMRAEHKGQALRSTYEDLSKLRRRA